MTESTGKRIKSPNHPAFGFKTVMEKVRAIHAQKAKLKNPGHILATELAVLMGYELDKNGKPSSYASRACTTLVYHGILEHVDGAKVLRFTSDGKTLSILTPEHDGWEALAVDMALRPKIYQEVFTDYGGKLPSDPELELYLEEERKPPQKPFNPKSVRDFVRALKETEAFVLEHGGTLPGTPVGDAVPEMEATPAVVPDPEPTTTPQPVQTPHPQETVQPPLPTTTHRPAVPSNPTPIQQPASPSVYPLCWPIGGGKTVSVTFHGGPPSMADWNNMIKQAKCSRDIEYPKAGNGTDPQSEEPPAVEPEPPAVEPEPEGDALVAPLIASDEGGADADQIA